MKKYKFFAVFLYLLIGKKLILNTHNVLLNIFSLLVLVVIIFFVTLIAYNSVLEKIIRIPFFPIGQTIAHFFNIKEKYIYLIFSILPSLSIWIGQSVN